MVVVLQWSSHTQTLMLRPGDGGCVAVEQSAEVNEEEYVAGGKKKSSRARTVMRTSTSASCLLDFQKTQ